MNLKAFAMTAVAAVMVASMAGAVFAEGTASTPGSEAKPLAASPDDDIIAKVKAAIVSHDLDYFEAHLVDWDGVRKRTQRLTLFQIRACFGRPIKSIGLEPFKPDPEAPLVPEGYRTNLPVTHLLRISFDEQHGPDERPACVFMLSKDPKGLYRMALVLSNTPPPK